MYYGDATTQNCEKCAANCVNCADVEECYVCMDMDGFYLEGGECIACADGC